MTEIIDRKMCENCKYRGGVVKNTEWSIMRYGRKEIETFCTITGRLYESEHLCKRYKKDTENGGARMSELKPCPFCGIELIKLAEKLYQHPKNDCWESSAYVDGDEAIEAWNRREGKK